MDKDNKNLYNSEVSELNVIENQLKEIFNFNKEELQEIESFQGGAKLILNKRRANYRGSNIKGSKKSKGSYRPKRALNAGMLEFARVKKEAASLIKKDGKVAMMLAKIPYDAAKIKLGIKQGDKISNPKALADEAISLLRKNIETYKKMLKL